MDVHVFLRKTQQLCLKKKFENYNELIKKGKEEKISRLN